MAEFDSIDKGLFNWLAADTSLANLIDTYEGAPAIFRGVAPLDAVYPYINMFDISTSPDDTHDTNGEQAVYQINVHSLNYLSCRDIMTEINIRLHHATFSIIGYSNLEVKRISGPSALPQDGEDKLVSQTADFLIVLQEV